MEIQGDTEQEAAVFIADQQAFWAQFISDGGLRHCRES